MSRIPYVHLTGTSLADVPLGGAVDLDPEQRRHLHRVLRLQAGAEVVVADGVGREAAATLGVNTIVVVGPVVAQPRPSPRLHLVQALAKGRKVDDVVRSATELGVDRITLVDAERSVLRVAQDKVDRLRGRWEAVAKAAAEQACRPWLPEVRGPLPLAAWVDALPAGAVGVVGDPASGRSLRSALDGVDVAAVDELLAVVGPEGGLTDAEVRRLGEAGIAAVSLGEAVLRTEHAGHALCAVLSYHLGRMG